MKDIIKYNDKEINNFKNGKILVVKNKKEIYAFINDSQNPKYSCKLYFGKLGSKLAEKIKNDIGIDIENYNLSLKSDSVKHILNYHSNKKELLRGQIPITIKDFTLIPTIISNYDNIAISGKTREGKTVITFEKKIESNYYIINYISDKRHSLEVKTMYKRKKKNPFTGDDTIKSHPNVFDEQ